MSKWELYFARKTLGGDLYQANCHHIVVLLSAAAKNSLLLTIQNSGALTQPLMN